MNKSLVIASVAISFMFGAQQINAAENPAETVPQAKPVKPTFVSFTSKKVDSKLGAFKMDGFCINEFARTKMCRTKKGIKNISLANKTDDSKAWVHPVTINTSGYFTTCYSWEWETFNTEEDTLSVDTLKQTSCEEAHPVACCKQ